MDLFYQDFAFDGRQTPLEEIDPTAREYVGASFKQTLELNPTNQLLRLNELGSLGVKQFTQDEFGVEQLVRPGLEPDDPRARVLSLDQANEEGKSLGLRFSEPPTRAQFDYLAELKQEEQQRAEILAKSPGIAATGIGFLADLAGSAIDPINIASAFVPIVGEGRYMRMVSQMGKGPARLAKGAAEGAVGTAMVEPLVYLQAQQLQQEFTLHDAFMDVVIGGVLGSGLHWSVGKLGDLTAGRRFGAAMMRQIEDTELSRAPLYPVMTIDRRGLKVPDGEAPQVVESLTPQDRAKVLDAAVKSVENDQWPRIDELLKVLPEAKSIAMTDSRYPATTRLQSGFTAADFVRESPATEIVSQHLARSVKGADSPDVNVAFDSLFKHYAKGTKKLDGWSIWTRTDEAYRADSHPELLEHPEQKVYVDAEAKTIVASDVASLAAVRHEIERAMDAAQGYKGGDAGGYRFKRGDNDGPVIHRKALSQLYKDAPDRAPVAEATSEQAVDMFSRNEPIMRPDERASQEIWDQVENDKDKDLDTLMKDEEIEVLEDTLRHVRNSTRAKAALEKVIPVEERDLLDMMAVSSTERQVSKTADRAVQEAVDKNLPDADLINQVRSAFDKDPDLIEKWLRGEISDEEFDGQQNRPMPEKTPDEGDEVEAQSDEELFAELEAEVLDRLKKTAGEQRAEDALEMAKHVMAGMDPAVAERALMDFGEKILEITRGLEPADLADIEARLVAKEQQLLSGPAKTRDLFNAAEKEEFDEANRQRTLRESQGASSEVRGAAAGQQAAGTALEDGLFATRTGGDGPPVGGKVAQLDAERSAAGGERSPTETARSIGYGAVPSRVITPDGSIEVGVEPVIVEYGDLRRAEGRLQPRDRTRKESDANITARANRLDPEQLMPTRVSDSGPPIVTKDGVVISGNGRYATIGQVYAHETLAAQAQKYRDRLGPAGDGYRQPILVMRITDDLSEEELIKFADRSNRGRIESMSATEKAQRDVQAAGFDLMLLYEGGDFEKRENRQFLQAFMRRVVTTTELGEMSKNGRLTKEGYDRLNAAVLAAAYDDTGVLSLMLESADDNIRSITNAYRDVAPAFMKLRAEIAADVVMADMDLTPYMMEAARIISQQRDKGVKIYDFLAQQDAFNPLDRTVETLIRAYYNKDLTRAASGARIIEYLTAFVEEARQHKTGGFLPDDTNTMDVLGVAQRRVEIGDSVNAEDPTGLLSPEPSPVQSAQRERQEAPQSVSKELGGETVGRQPLTIRAAKLESLKGNKGDFAAYVKKLGTLKKVDLERTAESYLGRTLTAKERKTKQTVLDTLNATVKSGETPTTPKAPAIVDPNLANSIDKLIASDKERLGGIESDIRVKMNSLKGLYGQHTQLDAMQRRIDGLRAGTYDDRNTGRRIFDRLMNVDPQKVRELRADTLEGKRDFVDRASKQLWEDYNRLAGEANAIMENMEALEAKRDTALGRGAPGAVQKKPSQALEAPSPAPEAPSSAKNTAFTMTMEEAKALGEAAAALTPEERLASSGIEAPAPVPVSVEAQREALLSQISALQGEMRKLADERVEIRRAVRQARKDNNAAEMDRLDGVYAENWNKYQQLQDEAQPLLKLHESLYPAKAPQLSGRELARAVVSLDQYYLGKKHLQRWKAWREADTKLRSDVLGGLSDEDVRTRVEAHEAEGNALIAEHNKARAEDLDEAERDTTAPSAQDAEPASSASLPSLSKFYDYLEGTDSVKSIRHLAKQMGIGQEEASKLIDHGIDNGWLKMKDDGTVIRVPKTQRPVRPASLPDPDIADFNFGDRIANYEAGAIMYLSKKYGISTEEVMEGWGFIDHRDYARLAQKEGYWRDPEYHDALLKRDLQAELITIRVMQDSVRILPQNVGAFVMDHVEVSGKPMLGLFDPNSRMVKIAKTFDEKGAINTLHHETVHALRYADLFTKHEWDIVRAAADAEGWLVGRRRAQYERFYKESGESGYFYRGVPLTDPSARLELLVEEAFAHRYGEWASSRRRPETPVEMLFQRIKDFLERLMLKAKQYFKAESAEDIFKAINRGDLAKRWSELNGGRVDRNASNSAAMAALKEQVDDINARLKELATDDSEALGNAAVRSIEALVPCAVYHA